MDGLKKLEPRADILVEAMRSMGYTFESALADVIDNSITAEATRIDIDFNPSNNVLSIFDNGKGMTYVELIEAMRWGSKDPLIRRDKDDLGRFGLGLKSASLSQCRKLTVISKKDNIIKSLTWNLDVIRNTGEWNIVENDINVIKNQYNIEQIYRHDSGTIVIWENFDKFEAGSKDLTHSIENALDYACDYLSLVFHIFINENLVISVNSRELPKIDPFLRKNSFTQSLKTEDVLIKDKNGIPTNIEVTPYVLPHFSSLSNEDKLILGKHDNFRNKQGFYIYRNKRLLIWGTWFRMTTNNELYKNARVKVEIPNTLDDIWNIDIKKSTASIPSIIKSKLFFSVKESIEKSEKIYTKRAINTNIDKGFNVIWNSYVEGKKSYHKINRELPIITKLTDSLEQSQIDMLEIILSNIESNLPKYEIYTNLSKGIDQKDDDYDEIFSNICSFIRISLPKNLEELNQLIGPILNSEPYCSYPDLYNKILEAFDYAKSAK